MPDSTASEASTSGIPKSRQRTEGASSARKTDGRKTHLVLQGKGGVGKTLAALLLAQAIAEAGEPLLCFDTDPVNASMATLSPIETRRVSLFRGDKLDGAALDEFAETIITTDTHCVIDNGAASFIPVTQFLLGNRVAELMEEYQRPMLAHVPITGGSGMADCVKGLSFALEKFPASVSVVPWLNELHGPIVNREGKPFTELPVYLDNRDRMPSLVTLPELSDQTKSDLRQMLEKRLSFSEAVRRDSPALGLLQRSRLFRLREAMWPQLQAVI